jgi:GNAT superfamily N-acetyltransferase
MRIDELSEGDAYRQLGNLAALLVDVVEGGASVSFLAGLTAWEAEGFWIEQIDGIPTGRTHLFAALDGSSLVGTVLLLPADKPNQPHRADVAKLLVLRSARRRGVASLLMDAMEARALVIGRTVLTLDTAKGSSAELIYVSRGYVRVGEIPSYSLTTDGRLESTIIYYKHLT